MSKNNVKHFYFEKLGFRGSPRPPVVPISPKQPSAAFRDHPKLFMAP